MMTVVHAHKGVCMYVTKFTGFEAHSSMTHLGVSAVHFAGEFVHYLNTLQDELDGEQRRSITLQFERTTPEDHTNPASAAKAEWF